MTGCCGNEKGANVFHIVYSGRQGWSSLFRVEKDALWRDMGGFEREGIEHLETKRNKTEQTACTNRFVVFLLNPGVSSLQLF